MRPIFRKVRTVPSLETFVWITPHLSADHALSFLSSNPQISRLGFLFAQPPDLLETKLLPLLSQSFGRLKSLNLTWEDISIPDSALDRIGGLQSLRQLSLSARHQFGWRYEWVINHSKMLEVLGQFAKSPKDCIQP
jgi:hypothetical protein